MILAGKPIADQIAQELTLRINRLSRAPRLVVLLIGSHLPSETYVNMKTKACQQIGIDVTVMRFDEKVAQQKTIQTIDSLNQDNTVDGILVQFPLPAPLDMFAIIEALDPQKDVDGFHPMNMGKLLLGLEEGFIPCTPLAIKTLLERYDIDIAGRHVVIVGRSLVVGRPLALLLMQNKPGANATVTVAHSHSHNLKEITKKADILVAAVGKAHLIDDDMIKKGAIVIDVGINRLDDPTHPKGYRLAGDVHYEKVAPYCHAITPVPGGVGPMTVAMLLSNTVKSAERRILYSRLNRL